MTTSQITKKIQKLEEELLILRHHITILPMIKDRRAKVTAETRGTLRPAIARSILTKIKRYRQTSDRF